MRFLSLKTPEGSIRRDLVGARFRIGRASGNDLVLDDRAVSRVHAEIRRTQEGAVLIDLKSQNGTYLNDRRLEQAAGIHPGDRIRVGSSLLVFNEDPASQIEYHDQPLDPGLATTYLTPPLLPDSSERPMGLSVDSSPAALVEAQQEMGEDRKGVDGEEGRGDPRNTLPDSLLELARASLKAEVPGEPRTVLGEHSLGELVQAVDREFLFGRPLDDLLEKIMEIAGRVVSYERGALLLLEDGEPRPKVVRGKGGNGRPRLVVSRSIVTHALRTRESVLVVDAPEDLRFRVGTSIGEARIRSVMCVPLATDRDVVGAIYVDNPRGPGLFGERDLRALTFLANLAAVRIENLRLFEDAAERRRRDHEFQEAAEIQRRMLPIKSPRLEGYQLDGTTLPCYEIGGDFYDYIDLGDGRLGIAIGDVTGKGLPAALLMSQVLASLRALAELGLPLDELVRRLNRQIHKRIPEDRFATLLYCEIDPKRHRLVWVNAGHEPAWILRSTGGTLSLGTGGLPVGMFGEIKTQVGETSLEPGDVLVAYSDGVTDTRDPEGEWFRASRLLQTLRGVRGLPAAAILADILTAVDAHGAGAPHPDDITLVVLRRED